MTSLTMETPSLIADRGHMLTEAEQYERKLVWFLCNFLQQRGFMLVQVSDPKHAWATSTTGKAVMEFVFDRPRQESRLVVGREGFEYHWIDLAVGHGPEIIVDYHYTVGDMDSFDNAMTLFIGTVSGDSQ